MGWFVWSCVCVLVLCVYLRYPPPQMSPKLQQWRGEGRYFTYKTQSIFYKDTGWLQHAHHNTTTAAGATNPTGDRLARGTGAGAGGAGTGGGPTLVCLHGFPSFSYDWSKVWPNFQSKFSRVIALDFLGFGFSGKPEEHEYHIMEQADIVESLLEYLHITDVHIMAHDYGDTVAQELLYRHEMGRLQDKLQYHIQSICFTNGGMFPDTHYPRLVQKLLLIPGVGALCSRIMFFYGFKTGFSEVFGEKHQPTREEFIDFWAAIRFNDGQNVMYRILEYIHQRQRHELRWTSALEITSVPVKLIYGPADPVNPLPFINKFKKLVPNASITLLPETVSHYPHWETPDLFIDAYWSFLDF